MVLYENKERRCTTSRARFPSHTSRVISGGMLLCHYWEALTDAGQFIPSFRFPISFLPMGRAGFLYILGTAGNWDLMMKNSSQRPHSMVIRFDQLM